MPKDHSTQFFLKAKEFYHCRKEMAQKWNSMSTGLIEHFPTLNLIDGEIDPSMRQKNSTGETINSLVELYQVAEVARVQFIQRLLKIVELSGLPPTCLKIAPLKCKSRATEKAENEYKVRKDGPPISWLYDIVRGAIICENEEQINKLSTSLFDENGLNDGFQIIRMKNRFTHPTPGGYRDLLFNIRLTSRSEGEEEEFHLDHICELQIHCRELKELDHLLSSHSLYEYFRVFFRGNSHSIENRLALLEMVLGNKNNNEKLTQKALKEITSSSTDFLADSESNSFFPSSEDTDEKEEDELDTLVKDFISKMHVNNKKEEEKDDTLKQEEQNELQNLLELFDYMSEYEYSIEILTALMTSSIEMNGESHPLTANYQLKLATAYSRVSDYRSAQPLIEKSLEFNQNEYGKEDKRTLSAMKILGDNLYIQGNYPLTMTLYLEILSLNEKVYGLESIETHRSRVSLASLYFQMGDYPSSKSNHLQALSGLEKLLGQDHRFTLESYNNLGNVYHVTGDFLTAKSYFERAVEGRERILGPDHPSTLDSVNNLGYSLLYLNSLPEARSCFERALEGRGRVFGRGHPSWLDSIFSLGNSNDQSGNYQEAIKHYEVAYEGFVKAFGPLHLRVINALECLTWAYYHHGDFLQFQSHKQLLLDRITECFPPDNPRRLSLQLSLENSQIIDMGTTPLSLNVTQHPHPLTKSPRVNYPGGSYGCDICGLAGRGWVYRCEECGFDIHPQCALKHQTNQEK